jgi:type II restriction enzyme
MAVNLDKPHLWKADIARSVDMYNAWFVAFAPQAFRETRSQTTREFETALRVTNNLTNISPAILRKYPEILPTLRMSTCPPLAADRLSGLAGVSKSIISRLEKGKKLPVRLKDEALNMELAKLGKTIEAMADPDIFVWLNRSEPPTEIEVHRAATIVADRLCGSVANPIIRNAQETRQLAAIKTWLLARAYRQARPDEAKAFASLPPGTFGFRMNVPVDLEGHKINIPIDAVIMPKTATEGELPVFFEAKSAGDFTNVNKRRKEEAVKMAQLRRTYGSRVRFSLFLCGYFDTGYLGYEAAEGIDWVWEHRIDDLACFGL